MATPQVRTRVHNSRTAPPIRADLPIKVELDLEDFESIIKILSTMREFSRLLIGHLRRNRMRDPNWKGKKDYPRDKSVAVPDWNGDLKE